MLIIYKSNNKTNCASSLNAVNIMSYIADADVGKHTEIQTIHNVTINNHNPWSKNQFAPLIYGHLVF